MPKGKKKIQMGVPSSSSSAPPWVELPRDATGNIPQRLGAVEILENDNMCRDAVNRSQGQLIDINMEYFGTDELLQYISERSSHLRRLRLVSCSGISGKGLREAVKNFPQLEELHLFFMSSVHAEDIETIGISCPLLKSFTFSDRAYQLPPTETNDYALAVAKTMPNLHHLGLFGNMMNDEGLEAILNGCPHLESLDLRWCFSVKLSGELGERAQQIKDLRRPSNPTTDFEWLAAINGNKESLLYGSNNYPIWRRGVTDEEVWFSD